MCASDLSFSRLHQLRKHDQYGTKAMAHSTTPPSSSPPLSLTICLSFAILPSLTICLSFAILLSLTICLSFTILLSLAIRLSLAILPSLAIHLSLAILPSLTTPLSLVPRLSLTMPPGPSVSIEEYNCKQKMHAQAQQLNTSKPSKYPG
ncbi:hypothetical protein LXA43DRAFT_1093469 [Ganoderma leucocontextum]|nr:hypothetical protein LXA43DRAFT_1093469 [Ganoderma leucocontextum]